jgi:hypothetical protein
LTKIWRRRRSSELASQQASELAEQRASGNGRNGPKWSEFDEAKNNNLPVENCKYSGGGGVPHPMDRRQKDSKQMTNDSGTDGGEPAPAVRQTLFAHFLVLLLL